MMLSEAQMDGEPYNPDELLDGGDALVGDDADDELHDLDDDGDDLDLWDDESEDEDDLDLPDVGA